MQCPEAKTPPQNGKSQMIGSVHCTSKTCKFPSSSSQASRLNGVPRQRSMYLCLWVRCGTVNTGPWMAVEELLEDFFKDAARYKEEG
jgi:hypothetical protein